MPTAEKNYYDKCGPELKQRILACLYMNQGVIEDSSGNATRKLFRLMVVGHTSYSTVRTGLRALEKQGVILRDVRGGKPNSAIPGSNPAGSRCYAIMMVNQDDRPEEWAITELQDQINHRLLAKAAGAETRVKQETRRANKAEAEVAKVAEVVSHLEAKGDNPVDDLATSLLSQVLAIIAAPPVQAGVPTAEHDATITSLANVQANLDKCLAACKDQEKELDQLRRENKELKSQLGKSKGQEHLSQRLKEVLTPEEWARLMQPGKGA